MCGIIGYIGEQNAVPILIEGLKRLEYRGYDSAGIAVINGNQLAIRKAVGKLKNLEGVVWSDPPTGTLGIGHTRWATHGRVTELNAHPHETRGFVVVHNGIIENYLALKEKLLAEGHDFRTETDTEVIVHLIAKHCSGDLTAAVRQALQEVVGAYAIAVLSTDDPNTVVGARHGCPLVVGLGQGAYFLASDIPAVLNHTRDVIFLDDGEVATLTREGVRVTTLDGQVVSKEVRHVTWDPIMAEKGGYKHFMLKEIYEQPRAVLDTFRGRLVPETGTAILDLGQATPALQRADRVTLVACGTSWHAALIGKYMFEALARIPTEVDYGSEFRYRQPVLDQRSLFVGISQSGETADTIAAAREAKRFGATVLAISNVMDSTLARESDGVLYTHAGPEIGVAASKTFTTQLVSLYLLGLALGRQRGALSEGQGKQCAQNLLQLPRLMESVLEQEEAVAELARQFAAKRDFLFLGRGLGFPIALEGALKLKELSYIHAEGYAGGEMKHGPIALIDQEMPVVVVAPRGSVYDKILSNVEEIRARDGIVIAVGTEGDDELKRHADYVLYVPDVAELLQPLVTVLPLQLLAYHIAVRRGCDVDQPRNLAKSVTVE
ncbi:MAG TPA: glutamine--fructose-6-phosphate transaminase (isomerizing) [Alphaproteobacteria bacterium]|nr:glutamine--fructose-6-phosphate transaminase (isomerizing) [Alphaproteobacteria bacterium]